jgi:hypothetical protein
MKIQTPANIELLLHYYAIPSPHPRAHAPAVINATEMFIKKGCLERNDERGSGFDVTQKGRDWVKALCDVEEPKEPQETGEDVPTGALKIITDLLANPYPHDLIAIRGEVERNYGGLEDSEKVAAVEMDTYCTYNFMMDARQKYTEAQDAAHKWLSHQALPEHAGKTTVPFHKANIARRFASLFDGIMAECGDGRSVEVWRIKEEDGYCVRIFRPTDDGKIAELVFGLKPRAAAALAAAIFDQLSREDGGIETEQLNETTQWRRVAPTEAVKPTTETDMNITQGPTELVAASGSAPSCAGLWMYRADARSDWQQVYVDETLAAGRHCKELQQGGSSQCNFSPWTGEWRQGNEDA